MQQLVCIGFRSKLYGAVTWLGILSLCFHYIRCTSGYYVRGGPYKVTLLIGHSISMPYFNKYIQTMAFSETIFRNVFQNIMNMSTYVHYIHIYRTDALQTNYVGTYYHSWRDTPIRWAFDHGKLFILPHKFFFNDPMSAYI